MDDVIVAVESVAADAPQSTSSDVSREEEKWCDQSETLLRQWRTSCLDLSDAHRRAAREHRRKATWLTIPTLVISVVMSGVSGVLGTAVHMQYITMSAFVANGVLAGIGGYFDFAGLSTMHAQFSHRYANLAADITIEVEKARRFRPPADVFIVKTNMLLQELNKQAPPL